MKGYKAFNRNMTCKGFQFKIGKEYVYEGEIELCKSGFHFCRDIADCFKYYHKHDDRFAEIEAYGDIIKSDDDDDSECVTNKIRIVKEISYDEAAKMSNTGNSNTGNRNMGNCNTGNKNTGNYNTGNYNTGDKNMGSCNTGDSNTGDWNTGDKNMGSRNIGNYNTGNKNMGNWNTGDWNTGDWNAGSRNTGNYNKGDWNTGDWNAGNKNMGNWNTGNWNTGDKNTGDWNTGNYNTGNRNTGSCNTGDWNTTNYSSGCFCTKPDTIKLFNKPSSITYNEWINTLARDILRSMPDIIVEWVYSRDMTDEEKQENPAYKCTGGCLRVTNEKDARQEWWDGLREDEKQEVMNLPNFDADIFEECTGIRVNAR